MLILGFEVAGSLIHIWGMSARKQDTDYFCQLFRIKVTGRLDVEAHTLFEASMVYIVT